MKIVNRTEFMKMPAGTVFIKFALQTYDYPTLGYDDCIAIKEGNCGGDSDFIVQELTPYFEGCTGSDDWSDVMIGMLEGKESPPLDYDSTGRDGLFEQKQLFAVWNKDDLERMIARLQQALSDGYGD